MEIKKVVVCGDSFCSSYADGRDGHSHFSNVLERYGYNIINIARAGASNTLICFQLQRAIELNPDLVIFRRTDPNRIDIPVGKYRSTRGLKNFIYGFDIETSYTSPYVGDLDAPVMTNTFNGFLIDDRQRTLHAKIQSSDGVREAIKHYVTYIFNAGLQRERDTWMIEHWKHQMEKANVPYIELTSNGIGKELDEYTQSNPDKVNQYVYHTDAATQQTVADDINNWIVNR